MFNDFLTALIKKMTDFLQKNPDFFKSEKTGKENLLKELKIPQSFTDYLRTRSEEEFLSDLRVFLNYNYQPQEAYLKENPFFEACLNFFLHELGNKIDYLDSSYYLSSQEERERFCENLLKGDSIPAQALRIILINYTYQQMASEIQSLANKIKEKAPQIIVQSPVEITKELKKEIRNNLLQRYPDSFAVFQVNKKIIGGIRIFEDGKTLDLSWLSRVLRFTSLTTQ